MATNLMKKAGVLSVDFLRLENLYLAKLPALYSLLYQQYRKEIIDQGCAETALLLALGILLAQAASERRDEEQSTDLSGRMCFRFSELLAVLQLPEEFTVSETRTLEHGLGSLGCFQGNSGSMLLEEFPGFCAIDELMTGAYFCYWREEEFGFCLVRMARLQQSLWRFIQERSRRRESPPQSLLDQPQLLLQTLSEMRKSTLPDGRLRQNPELLQNCMEKLCQANLLLISGGPGSGKTTLLSSLLQIFQQAEKQNTMPQRKLEWVLCAPTARAAQRMLQSLRNIAASDTLEALTLHKLLGIGWSVAELYRAATRESQNYHSSKGLKLLRLDLLVLDEASMLDSEMAYRLFSRLHPQTRVILIGDPEQLPPVGFGAFWKEMLAGLRECSSSRANCLANCLVELQASYRSVAEIQQLSQNVLHGRELGSQLIKARSSSSQAIFWYPMVLPVTSAPGNFEQHHELLSYLWQNWCPNFALHSQSISQLVQIDQYFQWLENYTLLSPLQRGAGGAHSISQLLLQYGTQKIGSTAGQRFFHGCPIQITRNNYRLGLYNGDRGFCLNLDQGSRLYGVFARKYIGESGEGLLDKYYLLPIAQLDDCEASFVQTIHKSQGSEYRDVCVLLPEPGNFWSKPLLYTAITRAKQRLYFIGSEAAVEGVSILPQAEPFSLLTQYVRKENGCSLCCENERHLKGDKCDNRR